MDLQFFEKIAEKWKIHWISFYFELLIFFVKIKILPTYSFPLDKNISKEPYVNGNLCSAAHMNLWVAVQAYASLNF